MTKYQAFNQVFQAAFQQTLYIHEFETLIAVAVKPFTRNNEYSVALQEAGLISCQNGCMLTTDKADDLLVDAADVWSNNTTSEPKKVRGTRKAREVTEEMTEFMEYAKAKIEKVFAVREVTVNRSNYEITLEKRPKAGYRQFQVLNRNVFRIFGYKVPGFALDEFKQMGCEYREAGSNVYIDIDCTNENIDAVLEKAFEIAEFYKG